MDANSIFNILTTMYPDARCELNYQSKFQLLISVVLSAQTTDILVNRVTEVLFPQYPTISDLAKAQFGDVKEIIKTIGLANTKAKNIISLSQKLVADGYREVPRDYNYLITLPGVGRKTANVVLTEGFNIPRIAVDTHVLRVSNRLGFVISQDPRVVEEKLMELYPEELWHQVHLRLLFFGRYFCKARNPQCADCPFIKICQYKKTSNQK
ncbi:MAG TPA: endonuclease III [Bacilli bacterium]|nr:endonuclease III [Bacilli bacterium]